MATRISAALVAVVLALFAPFAQAQQPFQAPFLDVLHNATIGGSLTLSGLGSGSQVSCLGLTSGNAVVASSGACGSGGGGGSGTVQNGNTGQIPAYNATGNTVGPLTGSLVLPGALTVNVATLPSSNAGQIITGAGINSGNYVAATIYGMACPGCTGFVDGLQSLSTVASGFTGSQQTGIASYVVDNAAASGGLRNAVGLFGLSVAAANGANVWGINTLLTDNTSQTTSSGTGKILQDEFDYNVTSPNTTVVGLALVGASIAQPAASNALAVLPLGTGITWGSALLSTDDAARYVMVAGLAGALSGDNLLSQKITLASTDGSGTRQTTTLYGNNGSLEIDSTAARALVVSGEEEINGANNTLALLGSSTGNPVAIDASGGDTNIGITLAPKGTGAVWLHGSALLGSGVALSPSATTGFTQIPTAPGFPSGAVGASGQAAIIVDTVDNEFCWSAGSWSCVGPGGGGGGNWTAAPVNSVSGGLSIAGGVLTDEWDGGLVTALGTGLSIDGSNNLNAQWSAGAITNLSGGLSISGTTLTFTGSGSGNVVGPGGGSLNNDCTNFNGTTGLLIQDAGGFCLIETSINPGDANYSIQPTNFTVATTTLTAARTWTLPAAASTNKSHIIRIADWAGAINATDTITIAANGSDTVNGGNSLTLSAQWSECDIQAAGTTSWLATCTIIPAYTPVANQFLTGITAAGVWSSAQPAFTDLSGQATLAQLPTLAANTILGRGSSGVPQQLTLSGCSISGTVFSCSGGGGSPGGSTNAVQYNAGSSTFGGVSLTSGQLLIGGATVPSAQTVSGDGTLSATGVLAIATIGGVAPGTAAFDNTGTSGATIPLLNGTNTWSATQTFGTIGGYLATISGKGGTYTIASTDCGTVLRDTSGAGVTFTLPNSLPIGCQVAVEQGGAGQITFSPASGATLNSAHGYTKTFGQYSVVGLMVVTNSGGVSAVYAMSGDGA